MHDLQNDARGGTAVWNIWKWDVVEPSPSGGFYDGLAATLQAGIRPFSLNDDYPNETPLTPAYFHGDIVGSPVDRGVFLVGYFGANTGGNSVLQIFWLTTVGPNASKFVTTFGTIDNIADCAFFPQAPQSGSTQLIDTGCRHVLDTIWRDGKLWLVTTIDPLTGSDMGEATAHWLGLDAPDQSTAPLVASQGDISGNVIVPETHTYYPAIRVSDQGGVLVGYAASAPSLHLSSFVSFLQPSCGGGTTVLAPEALRIGTDPYERTSNRWGDFSAVSLDPTDACFWTYNAHAIAPDSGGPPGDDGQWGTAHGKFCFDALVFTDGFESGDTCAWSDTVP